MKTNMKTSLGDGRLTLLSAGLVLAFLTGLPPASTAQGQDLDRIVPVEGRAIKATVLKDDYDKVVYKKYQEKSIPTSKVKLIVFGGLPEAFRQGELAERKADEGAENALDLYENAAGSFELAANTANRVPVKALAFYRAAICRMKLGLASASRLPQAIKAFRAFLDFAPKSRFSLDARLELARCYRLSGDLQGGLKVLEAFSKRIMDETLPAKWDALVQVEKIRTLLAGGKPKDALTMVDGAARALDEITPQNEEVKALQRELKFLEGKARVDSKDFTGAESFFQGILDKAGGDLAEKVVALAGLGETYYARGLAKKADRDLWAAYYNFAKAYVLDIRDGEMSARALYYQGACLLALGPLKAGRESAAAAKSYFEQVVKLFPLSDFAAMAAKKIK